MEDLKISLKAARVNADLTITEAAEAIGVSRSTLIKWEKEPWLVNSLFIKKVSEVYEMSPDNIIFLPNN